MLSGSPSFHPCVEPLYAQLAAWSVHFEVPLRSFFHWVRQHPNRHPTGQDGHVAVDVHRSHPGHWFRLSRRGVEHCVELGSHGIDQLWVPKQGLNDRMHVIYPKPSTDSLSRGSGFGVQG